MQCKIVNFSKKWVLMGPMESECSIGPSVCISSFLQKFVGQ